MEQRSSEWFAARMGKATASHMGEIMAKTKSGYGAGRLNYMVQMLCERLTGEVAEHYVSAPMQWGIDNEAYAISEYELVSGSMVESCGFYDHPTIPMSGASPDGLIGTDGLIETKCPNTANHIKTLLGEGIKKDYLLQMQWQMDTTGRAWCDFVSYDPRLPANLQLYIERVERDDAFIAEIRQEVILFLGDADKLEAKLRGKLEQASSEDKKDTGEGNVMPTVSENIDPSKLKDSEVF